MSEDPAAGLELVANVKEQLVDAGIAGDFFDRTVGDDLDLDPVPGRRIAPKLQGGSNARKLVFGRSLSFRPALTVLQESDRLDDDSIGKMAQRRRVRSTELLGHPGPFNAAYSC